jgi:hypothetical protein
MFGSLTALLMGRPPRRPVVALKALSATQSHPEVSAEEPLCVLHGTDCFSRIGMPDGSRIMDRNSAVARWRAEIKQMFPARRAGQAVNLEAFESDSSTLAASVVSALHHETCNAHMAAAIKCHGWPDLHERSSTPTQGKNCSAEVDAVVMRLREHVKALEAKERAQAEKHRALARKRAAQGDTTTK